MIARLLAVRSLKFVNHFVPSHILPNGTFLDIGNPEKIFL